MLVDRRMQRSRIGDVIEHRAIVWLLEEGFEVFKNVSCIGPIDLMVLDQSGSVFRVDVKKCTDASRNDDKITFHTKTEEQKKLDVRFLLYDEARDYFGWSVEEIYRNSGRPYKKSVNKKSKKKKTKVVFSKEFKSIPEIARFYKINERSLRERQRQHPNESLEQSVEEVVNKSKTVIVFGHIYGNRVEACRRYGVNSKSVEERMRVHGTSLEKTIQHFIDRNERKKDVSC